MKTVNRKTRVLLLGAVVTALIAAGVFIASCGSEYAQPSTTQTPTALISPATLKAWMDAGLVNGTGYDRVVIVDLSSSTNYAAGHIPGARWLDSNKLNQHRIDGPAVSATEVATGARMNELIQELGITRNTTIVFTVTSTSYLSPARAYYTFRYWGFPKNRLKVLDGLHNNVVGFNTWRILYPTEWWAPPAPDPTPPAAATTYKVWDNGTLRNDLRVSLSEMIDYAEGRVPNAIAIDVRGTSAPSSYIGDPASTGSVFSGDPLAPLPTDQTVFEGRINGAKVMRFSDLYNASAAGLLFKDPATIASYFTAASVGLDSTKTAYIYCKVGFMGAVPFFALDGILGWPVAFYDGSWSQWGMLSGNAAMGGKLAEDSRWRTDTASRSELIVYNDPSLRAIEVLTWDGSVCSGTLGTTGTITYSPTGCENNPALYAPPDSTARSGNQIEWDDMEFMRSGSGGSGGGGGAPGC